jgi:hypothetical protein
MKEMLGEVEVFISILLRRRQEATQTTLSRLPIYLARRILEPSAQRRNPNFDLTRRFVSLLLQGNAYANGVKWGMS